MPPTIPVSNSAGALNISHAKLDPSDRDNPKQIPKPLMDKTSSKEAAAKTKSGIPFFVPYFSSFKYNKDGTTTAGDTADKINPNIKAHNQGILNKTTAMIASTVASVRLGIQAKRKTDQDKRRKLIKSKPKPARVRMTTNAMERSEEDQVVSTTKMVDLVTSDKTRRTKPISNMPSKGGSDRHCEILPKTSANANKVVSANKTPPGRPCLSEEDNQRQIQRSGRIRSFPIVLWQLIVVIRLIL